MSTFLANALLYPVTDTAASDVLDDVVDKPIVLPENAAELGIPASVIEKSKRVYVPETSELRTVRWYACTISTVHAARVPQSSRVVDLKSGIVYLVDEVTPARRSIIGVLDTRLDLRKVAALPA